MIDLRCFPVVRVLLPFAAGSLAGYMRLMEIRPVELIVSALSGWLLALLIFRMAGGGKPIFQGFFCLLILALFFLAGIGTGQLDIPLDPGIQEDQRVVLKGRVTEMPVVENGRAVFWVEVTLLSTNDSIYPGKHVVKAYMQCSTVCHIPAEGELWLFCGRLQAVRNGGNPGEFDYASILRRKKCWYRFYCDTAPGMNLCLVEPDCRFPLPVQVRSSLSASWEGPPGTISLLKAVCLGDRSGLSESLRESYSMAGGMHVLAVSGLHVGLIWWVLNRTFFFLVLLWKKEVYRMVPIIIILWFFAYITGFSSSVCRSVTMFSFYSASRLLKHRGHPVNAILVSMFFLLLIHPGRLLDVGFQLSYAAIIAIVTLHPFFRAIARPGNRLIRWIWDATGVSLAAQIGTLPLVILYFHQVPLYALITNLVAIPLLSCIITIFVISAPMMVLGLSIGFANRILVLLGGTMNTAMECIAALPGSVIGGLFLDAFSAVMLMILTFLCINYLIRRRRVAGYLSVLIVCMTLCWTAKNRLFRNRSAQLIVSQFFRGSLVTFNEGLIVDHYIWSENQGPVSYMDRYLNNVWGRECYEVSVISLSRVAPGHWENGGISGSIQVSSGVWIVGNSKMQGIVVAGPPEEEEMKATKGVDAEFVLLSGEPLMNEDDLGSISTNLVVDGSNREWYTGKLSEAGLKFYDTGSRGAFMIHY